MHDHTTHIRKAAATALTLVIAALPLAACGGASKGTSSTGTSPTTSPITAPTTGTAHSSTPLPSATAASRRYEALRACLARNGVHVPKAASGKGSKAFGTPPPGVSAARYEAALQRCGFGGHAGVPAQLGSQSIKAALQRYAACMRAEGFDIPQPGAGTAATAPPIDTRSAKFKAAAAKCAPVARAVLTPGGR